MHKYGKSSPGYDSKSPSSGRASRGVDGLGDIPPAAYRGAPPASGLRDQGRYGANMSSTDFRTASSTDPRDALRDLRSQYYENRESTSARSQMQAHDMLRARGGLGGGGEYQTQTQRDSSQGRYEDLMTRDTGSHRTYEQQQSPGRPRRPPDNVKPTPRYDAVQQPSTRGTVKSPKSRKKRGAMTEREISRQNMEKSYANMMSTYARQQDKLASKPAWKVISTRDAEEPDDMMVTHINQTWDLNEIEKSPGLLDAKFAETMSSEEWLKAHSITAKKLNLKDLVDKGQIAKGDINPQTQKVRQHIQFEAHDINEFEYKLNLTIELYTQRIKWLMQGSRRYFGLVKGSRVGVMIDTSDSNCGFGRLSSFQEALTHLLDEQLAKKKGLYLQCFGTQPLQLWNDAMDIHCRSVEEAKQWIDAMAPSGGTNVLKALKNMFQRKDIDTILLVLGSTPDQPPDVLVDYVTQLGAGRFLPIQTVAYDCNNHITTGALQQIAENSGGRYHCYASSSEDLLYSSTDVALLVGEIQKAQDTCNKVKNMRQGMLGTALVSVMNEITSEVAKLPQSRFLPRPPGHEEPLKIEMANFQPSASSDWLHKHGLKAKNLDLYQVLAPNAYSFKEEFIPVIRKTVHSQVHGSAMTQFKWYDGTMKNVHVDMTQLFEYQKQLGSTVGLYEKRIDWLGSASRKIFGTVTESRVVILVDLSISNLNYLVHIQHSLRLLLEQQLANKDYFNIISFGSTAKAFRPTMVQPSPENLQAAWRYVLDMQCGGSRNFIDALRMTVENDDENKHNIEVEGVYLFTSGIPDQQADICCDYVEEAAAGRELKVHVALFNVDDYDAHGAIPSRYANITKTAECLRNLAHCSGGRFHWFRETGIIESDDIAAVNLEIEKALNFSKKCGMLVSSVKKKYDIDDNEMKALTGSETMPALTYTEPLKALPPPKHTILTQTRVEAAEVTEASKTLFRPSSANSSRGDVGRRVRTSSATDPMARVKGKRVQKAFFFTEDGKQQVGSVFRKYPGHKPQGKPIRAQSIPDREEQLTTKEWLRKYSLQRLKLNLNKLVSGPETRQTAKPVKILNKNVESRVYNNFPTINVNGNLQYLRLQPRELREYESQVEHVLYRYLRRLQWMLAGSRRVFSTVVEKKCVFLIDTSGSMDPSMEELKKELASLIWDQLHKQKVRFNLIQFSGACEMWETELVDPTEENCHRAVKWVSQLTANGNTCTLEALELAFTHPDLEAVYLLTDGKPDTSTSLVLKEVESLNNNRGVGVNTISFNCEDATANSFLSSLASQTGGRYHRCHFDFDAAKFAHKLLSEGFVSHEHPTLPDFEGDDLKRLGAEITAARRYLAQSTQYREIQLNHQRQNSDEEITKVTVSSVVRRPTSAKV